MEKNKIEVKLIITSIILGILVLALGGYIVYDKVINKQVETINKNNNSSNENNNTQNKPDEVINNDNNSNNENNNAQNKPDEVINNGAENIEVSSPIVKKAKDNYFLIIKKDDNVYKTNKYEISQISKYELIRTALSNVNHSKVITCGYEDYKKVNLNEVNAGLRELILNPQIITVNDFKNESDDEQGYPDADYHFYDYGVKVINSNEIKIFGPCDGEFDGADYIDSKIIKAEKVDNVLYIYEKQAFVKHVYINDEYPGTVDYYIDYEKTGKIETLDLHKDNNKEPKWHLYNTYKYTFEIVNDNYYFKSLELDK